LFSSIKFQKLKQGNLEPSLIKYPAGSLPAPSLVHKFE
jgi:hypothetical protein